MTTAPRYTVVTATDVDDPDTYTEHVVSILHGDQLRAELEAHKHGLTKVSAQPMHFTTLWIWGALTRKGITKVPFGEFTPTVVLVRAIDDDDPTPGEPAADPTQRDQPTEPR